MLGAFKQLAPGMVLIVLISGLMLYTDTSGKRDPNDKMKRIAILQHASVAPLDEGVAGIIDGLARRGWVEGKNIRIDRFNSQGEIATANTMASNICGGSYDLVITSSTMSMQVVANANKGGRVVHVFGLVAYPPGVGVGVSATDPMGHPPHMVGLGIFLPVTEAFHLARRLKPDLKTVGVVWNPGEPNSVAFNKKAKEVCAELGINLVDAAVDNSSGVLEATEAVIGKGAQAIWLSGDVMVSSAAASVIAAGKKAGIPCYSILPGKPDRGTLFDVGIDFYDAGLLSGEQSADILEGADPAKMPWRDVVDVVTHRLSIPEDVEKSADTLVDSTGIHKKPIASKKKK